MATIAIFVIVFCSIYMRIFKYPSLFIKAFNATKREMLVSVIILILVTFVLAFGLYIAEVRVRLEYSFWDAMVWNFVKYVGDPAEMASAPITLWGQIFGTLVGLMAVAIFAVPAGLVGSGLIEAMEETRQEKKIDDACVQLHKRFRRVAQTESWYYDENKRKRSYKFVPRYRSLAHLQVKTGLKTDDLIEAVDKCPDMRLVNMASCERQENHPQDRIAVVHFPLNREYGCCLDRESDVTIVSTASVTQIGTGNFAFSLAAMGGFNYVSKEIAPNPDDPFRFYNMKKSNLELIDNHDKMEEVKSQALHFLDDLKQLKQKSAARNRRHWFIFILASSKTLDWQVHLWRLATDGAKELPRIKVDNITVGSTITMQDESVYHAIASKINEKLSARTVIVNDNEQNIVVTTDNREYYKTVPRENVMRRMGGGKDCNAFTIRMAYDILVFNTKHLLVAKDIADVIKDAVEPDHEIPNEARRFFLEEGNGYANASGKEDVFKKSPKDLEKMISQQSKEARKRFQRYDLDGNFQDKSQRRPLKWLRKKS